MHILYLGSCLALNLSYSGCCVSSLSTTCSNNGCYCDQNCHILNNCCNDVTNIGCYPASPSSSIVSLSPSSKTTKEILAIH